MNLLHMKYAVAVADAGSINRASARLLIAQPNLSRAIKELEAELGTPIFERSTRGMRLTPAGESYIACAKKILMQMAEMEDLFKTGFSAIRRFSLCAPPAGYIEEALADFSCGLGEEAAELSYREADASATLGALQYEGFHLGILRHEERTGGYFEQLLERGGLKWEPVARFSPVLLFSRLSPLAGLPQPRREDLSPLIELLGPPPSQPEPILAPPLGSTHIRLSGQGSSLQLLCRNPRCFLLAPPVPAPQLERFGLMQRPCEGLGGPWRDLIAYRKDYRLSRLDKNFIACLKRAARKYLPPG